MSEPKRPYPNGVPIAPDTVMPPRRSVRWGATADSPPTEIHDDPGLTRAYLAGLAAGRTEAAADFDPPDAESLARMFHDSYEALAPSFGYITREASAVAWENVPADNKALMISTARAVLRKLSLRPASPDERLREALAGLLAADEAAAAGNPDLLFPAFDAARAALAAADREAPDEGCEPKETT